MRVNENASKEIAEKKSKKAQIAEVLDSAHADLIPDGLKPREHVSAPLTEKQLKRIESRQQAWLSFKYALIFRVWKGITGEIPHTPPVGTFDNTGKPKNGDLPQEYIIRHLGIEKPFTKKEHAYAFSVIAEMYEQTPADLRPDGKLWETLLEGAESLVEKWCGGRDPFFKMSFPDALKTARMEMRWTQGELADEVQYQSLAISRWERAEYAPSAQAIYEIAKRLPRMKLWFRDHLEWLKEHGVPAL